MNWKLFFSTFIIIFLAELGDKTQLAVMAASASNKTTLTVFLGAAFALVLSTFIAVVVGAILPKFLPEKVLKIVAGIAFLIFGLLYLKEALLTKEKPETPVSITLPAKGILRDSLIKSALYFEEQEISGYIKTLACIGEGTVKNMLGDLIEEEKAHIKKLRACINSTIKSAEEIVLDMVEFSCPSRYTITDNDKEPVDILDKLVKREEMMARFYSDVSRKALIKDVKQVFAYLAEEEKTHVEKLKQVINSV